MAKHVHVAIVAASATAGLRSVNAVLNKYNIYKVLLSARGYVVILARSAFAAYEKDMLLVYSINGEKVAQRELDESINAILFHTYQYYIVEAIVTFYRSLEEVRNN